MEMFYLIILFSCTAVFAQMDSTDFGPALDSVHRHLHDNCVKDYPVTDDDIYNVRIGKFDDNDERMKDYVLCLWRLSGLFDLSAFRMSKVLLDVYVPDVSNQGKGVDMYLNCASRGRKLPEGTLLRERTYVMMKCIHETDPEHFIMF